LFRSSGAGLLPRDNLQRAPENWLLPIALTDADRDLLGVLGDLCG